MTWFPELRKALAAKAFTPFVPFTYDLWPNNPYVMSRARSPRREYDVERAVVEVYERTVWAFKAIETITSHVAALPFRYREKKGDGQGKVIEDHPMYEVLNGPEANPLTSGPGIKKRIAAQLLMSPRGVFVEPTFSRRGDVIRLDVLPPNRTVPVPSPGPQLLDRFEVLYPDGNIRKIIGEEMRNIRWIKNDHPLDPYRSVTPMSAAGLSVQMDDLGRLVNVSWMSNDGNIRGIVTLKGQASDATVKRLEKAFGVGPIDAGKIVVADGQDMGGAEFVDLSSRPRDMQYKELAQNAKIETLAAFGVPESQLGNASGRTYDNAEAEAYIFWRITMLPILRIIAAKLHDRDNPKLEPFFDVSEVEELQIPLTRKKQLALQEVAAGVRSIWSYAKLAGLTDEVKETPETRALWFATSGKTALDQEDGAEERVQLPSAQQQMAGELPPGAAEAQQPGLPGQPAQAGQLPVDQERSPLATPVDQLAAMRQDGQQAATQAGQPLALQTKADDTATSELDERAQDLAEARVAAALVGLVDRWTERTIARLRSPKLRSGTRHWTPDPNMPVDQRVGDRVLDVMSAVNPDRWRSEAVQAVTHLLTTAGDEAALRTVVDLTGEQPVQGKVAVSAVDLSAAVYEAVAVVATAVGLAAAGAAASLANRLSQMDHQGASIADMERAIRSIDMIGWARRLANTATASAIESGRHAAVTLLGKLGFTVAGTWISKRDDRVRPTHRVADGQTQPVGRPFLVGGAMLRYPRDPLGPPQEVINCRCRIRYSLRRTRTLMAELAATGT
jgi:phage portal protein BeeE